MTKLLGGLVLPFESNNWPGYRVGQWYGFNVTNLAVGQALVGGPGGGPNSPIYATPIYIFAPIEIDELNMTIGTSTPGVLGRYAVAHHNPINVVPGRLIAECVGTADFGLGAATNLTLPFSTPLRLQRGWYWFLCMFDGNAQPFLVSAGNPSYSGVANLFGHANPSGPFRAAATVQTTRVVSSNNADFAQPFPLTQDFDYQTGAPGMPIITYRVSAVL